MRIPKNFDIDPDKKLSEVARELAKEMGVFGVNFIYNGKVLPQNQSLNELGIKPEELNTIMATGAGVK